MTNGATETASESNRTFPLVFQYTVEAYKTFQKLAEKLPNPNSASMFAHFARDERDHRDLLEIKYLASREERMNVPLGADLRFQDILEGDLSPRETAEWLLSRERTMERKLREAAEVAATDDQGLLLYIAAGKRAHAAYLERELELLKRFPDWFDREDSESLIVQGKRS